MPEAKNFDLAATSGEIAHCNTILDWRHGGLTARWADAYDEGRTSGVTNVVGAEYDDDGVPLVRLGDAQAHEYVCVTDAVAAVHQWYLAYANDALVAAETEAEIDAATERRTQLRNRITSHGTKPDAL